MKPICRFYVLFTFTLLSLLGCSPDFTDEQSSVISEFLNTSFYGQKDVFFSDQNTYSYVRLSFDKSENDGLTYKYTGVTYASFMNTRYRDSGDVVLSYDDKRSKIIIELLNQDGDFKDIEFRVEKDSIIKNLKERILYRQRVKEFKDNRKIKQSYGITSEFISKYTLDENVIAGPLWNVDYRNNTFSLGEIRFGGKVGNVDLIEEYDESFKDRPKFPRIGDVTEKKGVLDFFKKGFRVYDTNILEKSDILNVTEILSAKPRSKEKSVFREEGYVHEFDSKHLDFLIDKTWELTYLVDPLDENDYRSKKVSIDDETVIDKSIGLYNKKEPDGFGFYNDRLYLDVIISMKTDKKIEWYDGDTYEEKFMNHQLTERYKLYWGSDMKFLILIKKNITHRGLPHGASRKKLEVSRAGSYNNDYIILEKK